MGDACVAILAGLRQGLHDSGTQGACIIGLSLAIALLLALRAVLGDR